ncbi:MAG TPA: clostripain-related cysteine peptidase [Dinghuibacter sp.]|uniref:clostripain-related cysteine peptidase n=1 Tax=Dinghuibacter sp. TaxID=2024697 RepID=UPI002B8980A5|nr:clostripain-related cysteine peptidase [Dinghuibacter sp.]HTJ12993.1 clostripain-related cysteine peptidase [Dinghuibacter sp.]
MNSTTPWLSVLVAQQTEPDQDNHFLKKLLDQLIDYPGNPNVTQLVCVSVYALPPTLEKHLDGQLRIRRVNGDLVSLILELRDHRFTLVKELPLKAADFCNPKHMLGMFRFIRDNYPYKRLLLSTWDHGSAFGIFNKTDKRLKVHGELHQVFTLQRVLKGLRNTPHIAKPHCLGMEGLARAIRGSFGKADVLLLRNCFMQLFDTGYTLHDAARYLVAFEGTMYFWTYDTDVLLGALGKGTGPEGVKAICAAAVKSFDVHNPYKNIRAQTGLFANDLSRYPALDVLIEDMTRILLTLKNRKKDILACRATCSDLAAATDPGQFQLVDAHRWFNQAGRMLLPQHREYQRALNSFNKTLRKTVIDSFVGDQIGEGQFGASGFSLYFPSSLDDLGFNRSFYKLYYDRDSLYRSRFSRKSVWDAFIHFVFLDAPDKG